MLLPRGLHFLCLRYCKCPDARSAVSIVLIYCMPTQAKENDNTQIIVGSTNFSVEPKKQLAIKDRIIGARALSSVNFDDKYNSLIESIYEKAKSGNEHLYGKNGRERRNYAFLLWLETRIEVEKCRFESQLWDRAARSLILQPEQLHESYWRQQDQALRDEGINRKLSDSDKQFLIKEIQKLQSESLERWFNYFSHKSCPYPLWFKIYTLDGVSKMGAYDLQKRLFRKRNASTTAPYPSLNTAVLAKVYDAVNYFFSNQLKEYGGQTEDSEQSEELKDLVQSGNFNKLYCYFLSIETPTIETPARAEDICGDWIEYLPGDEGSLSSAAEGTPWCISSYSVAERYLNYGVYDDDHTNERNELRSDVGSSNKAKFLLFHLFDRDTGKLAKNACASIRLRMDGHVAEISGLKKDQALEDSLVPIVEEKVRSLPGGEKFLKAFSDNKQLIRLDRKMQAGDINFTKDALDFVFENCRPIYSLNI